MSYERYNPWGFWYPKFLRASTRIRGQATMSDIVERLCDDPEVADCYEAANTIKRLRVSRNETIEECAKVVRKYRDSDQISGAQALAASDIEEDIRALKDQP